MRVRFWKKGGAPAASAVDADVAYARRLYLGVLVFATIVSVVGNVFFAVQSAYIAVRSGGPVEMGPVASGLSHAIPPVLLLLIAEVWAVSMRVMPGQRPPRRGNAFKSWFLAGNQAWSQRAVFAIMLASFALSAQALFMIGVWTHVPPALAWLTPVMVDLTIVVCADKLWALSRSVRSRTAEPVPAVDSQSVDEAGRHRVEDVFAEHAAAHAAQRSLYTDEALSEHAEREPEMFAAQAAQRSANIGEQGDRSANIEVSESDVCSEQPAAQPEDRAAVFGEQADEVFAARSTNVDEAAAQPVEQAAAQPNEPAAQVEDVFGEHADRPSEHVAAQSAAQPDATSAHSERTVVVDASFAERVRDAANSKADVGTVARVLELTDGGGTRRNVGIAVGMSASTVSALVKAAKELSDDRPRLAAVK